MMGGVGLMLVLGFTLLLMPISGYSTRFVSGMIMITGYGGGGLKFWRRSVCFSGWC